MKTLFALLSSVALAAAPCFAQYGHPVVDAPAGHSLRCSHSRTAMTALAQQSAVVRRPYDVLSYALELDWRTPLSTTATTGAARQYRGVNTIRLRIDSTGVGAVELDSRTQQIDRVTIDGSDVTIAQPSDGILTVPLPTTPEPGDELTLRIEYTYTGEDNTGFHLHAAGSENGAVPERIAYTLGAPDYTRYWMPCNDNPHDKATASFAVAVPQGFTVACNGLPGITVDNGDGSVTHTWSDTAQIATYLMVVHASVYRHFSDVYHRQDGDSIPLLYYVWEVDYEGGFNAKSNFAAVPDMMERYASLYGEYPFSKYGMAVAMPFDYFAMENQTMTTLVRAAVREELTIAHELAHQWLGDLVTPATWNDIWMNEGGATFSEAVWGEHTGGTERYREIMESKRGFYLSGNQDGTKQPPCYRELDNNPVANGIYNYAITYAKGAWVYHMLRQLTGDEVFFPMLRAFLDTHAYGTAETGDMVASFEQYIADHEVDLPISIRTFFDQWVYKKGHPVYETTAAVGPADDGFAATVLLRQTQPTQIFAMPVEIELTGANNETAVRTIFLDERERLESFTVPFLPVSVRVDPNEKILCVAKPVIVTDVADRGDAAVPLQAYPNPAFGDVVHIQYTLAAAERVVLELFNTVGERVAVLQNTVLPAGVHLETWEIASVPPGTYVLHLRTGTKSVIRKISIGK